MAIARDFRKANLDPKDRSMLEYAEKITLSPSQVGEDDVSGLRKAGWSDREILSIAALTCYRNFISRMADAVGVELASEYKNLRKDYLDTLMAGKNLI